MFSVPNGWPVGLIGTFTGRPRTTPGRHLLCLLWAGGRADGLAAGEGGSAVICVSSRLAYQCYARSQSCDAALLDCLPR